MAEWNFVGEERSAAGGEASVAALWGCGSGCIGAGRRHVVAGTAVCDETAAEIHPVDVSTGLSLERAICEGRGNCGVQRAVEQRPAADLLRPDGVSPIRESGVAERGAARPFLQRGHGTCGGYGLSLQLSQWHDGAGADNRR